MFDFDNVIELMKKYGYSSTSVHPYIYQNGDNLGVCYTYIDDDFGLLERIKIFENLESAELFLKKLDYVRKHGRENNIKMALDNYESMNPKVVFLRDGKVMLEGEMFSIDDYDRMQRQREQLSDVSKLVYKAGDLLLVYDEIKGRQLQYLRNTVALKNKLREKYFELQKEIDKYNKYKVERTLNLLPDVNDIGINDRMEIAVKDRYNMYIAQPPTYEEAVDFLKEVWDLNKNLELNKKYYEAQKEENDTRNELKVVDAKLDLMKKLNDDYKPLFGIDLVSRFRKINKKYNLVNNSMSESMANECIENIERKYSVYDHLDLLFTSDYLREAMQNTNYGDLAIKYSNSRDRDMIITNKMPLNEVAASLSIQYRDMLNVQEQSIMVLYNNHKYRKLCNAILEIDSFDTLPVKKVISKISGIKGFSKIKSECYDIVKKRIDNPVNANIKASLFAGYDFTSFDSFVSSLIKELVKLRHVNNKMCINGNINMYLQIKNVDDILNKKFVMLTNDLNGLLNETKENKNMIGIVLLKTNTPVIYSPYYFDVGDIYSKDASLQMYIREMINFEFLIEISDIAVSVDPVKTNVVRYYTKPEIYDNISIVEDIMMGYKTTFCRYSFKNNLPVVQQDIQVSEVPQVNNVVPSVTNDVVTEAGNNIQIGAPVVSQDNNVENKVDLSPEVSSKENVQLVQSSDVNATKVEEAPKLNENVSVNNTSSSITQTNTEEQSKTVNKISTESVKVVENKVPIVSENSKTENKVTPANTNLQTNNQPKKIVKQVVSKPVSGSTSQVQPQPTQKKVVSVPVQKTVAPVAKTNGTKIDSTNQQNVVKQPVSNQDNVVTPTKTVSVKTAPVNTSTVKIVPKVSTTITSSSKPLEANVNKQQLVVNNSTSSKEMLQKSESVPNNNVVQKKVVVNTVTSQQPVKKVVVNNIGAPVRSGQPVKASPAVVSNKTVESPKTNIINNTSVEKNKMESVK